MLGISSELAVVLLLSGCSVSDGYPVAHVILRRRASRGNKEPAAPGKQGFTGFANSTTWKSWIITETGDEKIDQITPLQAAQAH